MIRSIDFKLLFDSSPNPYVLLAPDLTIVGVNEAYLKVTTRQREDIVGRNMFDAFPGNPHDPDDSSVRELRASFDRVLEKRAPDNLALIRYAIPRNTPDGIVFDERYWSATHTPLLNEAGEVMFIFQHTTDITELQSLKKAVRAVAVAQDHGPVEQMEGGVFQRALAVQETNRILDAELLHLRRLFEQTPGFVAFLRGSQHVFELANSAYYQLVGHRSIIGKSSREAFPELEGQGYFELLDQVYASGEPFVGKGMRALVQRKAGMPLVEVYIDLVYQPVIEPDGSISGIFVQGNDITEQKHAQNELERYQNRLEELVGERTRALEESQAALRQAQKMEAVGKLTGGVAHDFNNLLQIITGNLQLLQMDDCVSEHAQRRLATAIEAVDRGAKLAAQLLAFARRQPLQPIVINVGRLIRNMDDLLRRVLGESIAVETIVAGGLWNTYVDPGQLENVILNMAINARDAMGGEGKLTIEAGNAMLDDQYCIAHADVAPGQYVLLAISDTGSGMSAEVMERAFEPFYTTKPEGKGTGLGLSMGYGFVKQSEGHIKIYSEVGHGSTIKIYLPRAHQAEMETPGISTGPVIGGVETILVVEDDPDVRGTVVELLTDLGYRVLKASDGQDALAIIHSGVPIDLLFTDVVMPGPVRSPELAKRAKALLPDVEVLFTSGYTENAIVHGGRLDTGVSLLSKPYRREDLARKIRQLFANRQQRLDAPTALNTPADSEASANTPTPLHILVVEDDEDSRLSTCELLRMIGNDVTGVASAEQALVALANARVDVLFTDVSLPGMSGVELARETSRIYPNLGVIVASGYGAAVGNDHGFSAVMLPKPYGLSEMEKALEEVAAALRNK
jgi:PAS domain S-box-containing protein